MSGPLVSLALGSNEESVRLSGVNADAWKVGGIDTGFHGYDKTHIGDPKIAAVLCD